MTIDNVPPDPAVAGAARPLAPVPPVRDELRKPVSRREEPHADTGEDIVEISEEARARAARMEEGDVPSGTLPADRVLELRRRIQDRVHDDPVVIDEIMRRIADDGEL